MHADLAALVAADLPDKAIARRLGITPKAVESRRRRAGLRKHGRVRGRVLELLAAGWPVWRVAAAVGRCEQHVRQIRRSAAVAAG